jgi:hypothetical protein
MTSIPPGNFIDRMSKEWSGYDLLIMGEWRQDRFIKRSGTRGGGAQPTRYGDTCSQLRMTYLIIVRGALAHRLSGSTAQPLVHLDEEAMGEVQVHSEFQNGTT